MATGGDPLKQLREELICSICLDYFKDPVTLAECGHNFCRGCLAPCWGESEAEASCPLCKETVHTRNLQLNRQLANVAAIAKELSHREEKEAQGDGRFCKEHQEPLKLFCQEDQTLICVVCDRSKEHRSHEVVPLEEASQEYKDKFQASLKIVREERAKRLAHKEDIMQETQALLEQTRSETQKTVAEFRKQHQFLEEQEKLLLGMIALLENEIASERDERLARLSSELSCLESLIQDMEEKQQQPAVELLQDARSTLKRYEEKQNFGELVAFPPELRHKICNVCGINDLLEVHMKQFKDSLASGIQVQTDSLVSGLQVQKDSLASGIQVLTDSLASGLQVQKVNVTLDPETAHPILALSEDRKSVKWVMGYQHLPDNPERFDYMPCVMGCEEFTAGQHFWEVIVEGDGLWAVGVARKSVRRKDCIGLTPEEGIWAVNRKCGRSLTWSEPHFLCLPPPEEPKRILVSLNYEMGQVMFRDPDRGTVLHEFSGASFCGEPLRPFFNLSDHKAQLRLSP